MPNCSALVCVAPAPKLFLHDWVFGEVDGEAVRSCRNKGCCRKRFRVGGSGKSLLMGPMLVLRLSLEWLFVFLGRKPVSGLAPATTTEWSIQGGRGWGLRTICILPPGHRPKQDLSPSFLAACVRAGVFENQETGVSAVVESNVLSSR